MEYATIAQLNRNQMQNKTLSGVICASLSLLTLLPIPSTSKPLPEAKVPFSGCYVYGKLLAGKVQVVTKKGKATDRVPTFDVKVVSSFPDLKVKTVNSFPRTCGEWQFVNSFPDFKIRYVSSFPDFQIKMVTSFPGR